MKQRAPATGNCPIFRLSLEVLDHMNGYGKEGMPPVFRLVFQRNLLQTNPEAQV